VRKPPSRVYIRFVCFKLVQGQRNRLGLFQALDEARSSPIAPDWALSEVGTTYGWFKQNLKVPKSFGNWGGGLSWFKSPAQEHVAQMHRMKTALEACGVHVEMLTTRDPGIVIYEDEHQIVATPHGRRF
jgi:hypothetical protein